MEIPGSFRVPVSKVFEEVQVVFSGLFQERGQEIPGEYSSFVFKILHGWQVVL